MSFMRLIYWTSLIGGWSAFVAWLLTEVVFGRWIDPSASSDLISAILVILMTALIASAIAGGISLVSAISNPSWLNIAKRVLPGLVGGFIAGLVGAFLGEILFYFVGKIFFLGILARIIGLTLVGLGIGVIEGLLDRSWNKIRNGLLGGLIGGFLGGTFFIPIALVIGSVSGRAFAFVLLGLFIGLFIGLVQVVLKEAWLTVEAGFRPGRQTILTQDVFSMGTSEQANLIFIAYGAKGVEPIHLRITKQKGGGYLLEDNASRTGTLLNADRVAEPTMLRDGDAIQFGVNIVRFNEVVKHGDGSRRPPTVAVKEAPKPAIPGEAITAKAPLPAPAASTAVQPRPASKPVAVQPAPKPAAIQTAPKPAPKPATPAAAPKPQEGQCPICDKRIVGIPGERRCKSCFTTF